VTPSPVHPAGATAPGMIHELRIYTACPGRMPALLMRFREHTCRLFGRHGIRNVGYWTTLIGGASDQLWYIVEFDSLAHRESAWSAFLADPEWIAVSKRSTADGPLIVHFENLILKPTDFSALGTGRFDAAQLRQ
jgi:NIPSNAP